ncbi:MAG: Hpt domain-containing protein [Myxococcota bacterium]
MSTAKLDELDARLRQLASQVLGGLPVRAATIRAQADAIDEGDDDAFQLLLRSVHRLRGVAGNLGNGVVGELASRVEAACEHELGNEASTFARKLASVVEQVASQGQNSSTSVMNHLLGNGLTFETRQEGSQDLLESSRDWNSIAARLNNKRDRPDQCDRDTRNFIEQTPTYVASQILVLTDDEYTLRIAKFAFQTVSSYAVYFANDLQHARQQVGQNQIDLILVGMAMEGSEDERPYDWVNPSHQRSNLAPPVILALALDSTQDCLENIAQMPRPKTRVQPDAWLHMPVSPEQLLRVSKVLLRRRSQAVKKARKKHATSGLVG